jgi:hypothetical protein
MTTVRRGVNIGGRVYLVQVAVADEIERLRTQADDAEAMLEAAIDEFLDPAKEHWVDEWDASDLASFLAKVITAKAGLSEESRQRYSGLAESIQASGAIIQAPDSEQERIRARMQALADNAAVTPGVIQPGLSKVADTDIETVISEAIKHGEPVEVAASNRDIVHRFSDAALRSLLERTRQNTLREARVHTHDALRKALRQLRSYNVDVKEGRINYRPDDHIAFIDATLNAGGEA